MAKRTDIARSEETSLLWGVDRELAYTALRMLAYFSAFVIATLLVVPESVRLAAQESTAVVSAVLIKASGVEVVRQGTLLMLPGITLAIDYACTAITILELYAALILAYRAPWSTRALGLGVGSVVILVANQLRILATALAAEYWPSALHIAHDYLFQVSMVVVAVALWAWWLGRVGRAESTRG